MRCSVTLYLPYCWFNSNLYILCINCCWLCLSDIIFSFFYNVFAAVSWMLILLPLGIEVYWWWNHGITYCVCPALFVLPHEWHATRSSWRRDASPSSLPGVADSFLSSSSCPFQPGNGWRCPRNAQGRHILGSQEKQQKLKMYRFCIFILTCIYLPFSFWVFAFCVSFAARLRFF